MPFSAVYVSTLRILPKSLRILKRVVAWHTAKGLRWSLINASGDKKLKTQKLNLTSLAVDPILRLVINTDRWEVMISTEKHWERWSCIGSVSSGR